MRETIESAFEILHMDEIHKVELAKNNLTSTVEAAKFAARSPILHLVPRTLPEC